MTNIVGDILQRPAIRGATIALMDIKRERLSESELVASKLIGTLGVKARGESHTDQRRAREGADFVIAQDSGRVYGQLIATGYLVNYVPPSMRNVIPAQYQKPITFQ